MRISPFVVSVALCFAACKPTSQPAEINVPTTEEEIEETLVVGMTESEIRSTFGSPAIDRAVPGGRTMHFLFSPPEDGGSYIGGVQLDFENGQLVRWNVIHAHRRTVP